MATTYDVLERAERAERLAGLLYRTVAEAFPEAAEVPTFRRLADEEDQHAARIRLLAARYRHDPRLFENADFKSRALDEVAHAVETLHAEVIAGRWASDYPGLLDQLCALEERGAASHAEVLAEGAVETVAEFFRQMAAQDRSHRLLLAAVRGRA